MKSTMPFSLQGIALIAILTFIFTTNYTASAESLTVTGDLDVQGIVTIGNNTELPEDQLSAGSIRWTGSAFEAYDGESWKTIPISVFAEDGSAKWGSSTNSVTGLYSTVWGFENTVSGTNASAWGRLNKAEGNFSNAWGFENTASGINVTAWGKNNTAESNFSTVWGIKNTVSGLFATAWGRYVNAPSRLSTAFGMYNIGSVTVSENEDGTKVWIDKDPLIEVGVGGNAQSRANALTLLKDGRIALGKHSTLDNLQNTPETLQVQGALKVGDYPDDPGENVSAGAIRFGDNDLLGYVDGSWKSLTQGNHFDGDLQVNGTIVLADHAGDIPSITY